MDLKTQGECKFPASQLLDSSRARGWRGILAELRAHTPSDVGIANPTQAEIAIAIAGTAAGCVTRHGAGMHQQVLPVDGTIWLSPVGVEDKAWVAAPIPQVLHVFLSTDPFSRLAEEHNLPGLPGQSIYYASGVTDDLILQIGLSIFKELRYETAAGAMLAETGAVMLAARLAQCHSGGMRKRAPEQRFRLDQIRLRRTLDYIDAHLDHDITVQVLARQCCLSVYHFIRMFSAAVGMPPYRYVAKKRLEKSKRLLLQGDLPLSEIAQIAGFSSQASFTRAFTRDTGIPPGRFRIESV